MDRSQFKRLFSWDILFHMLGTYTDEFSLSKPSKTDMLKSFRHTQGKPTNHTDPELYCYQSVLKLILDYEDIQVFEGISRIKKDHDAIQAFKQSKRGLHQKDILQKVIFYLGCMLDPYKHQTSPRYGHECSRRATVTSPHFSEDGPDNGYSRDPFKLIEDRFLDDVTFASACHLLRGHSLFFCRRRSLRDFNAAKTALNDFHQSYFLAWRLYQALSSNHHREPWYGVNKYYQAVIDDAETPNLKGLIPGHSSYYIWSLILLSNILRGNVYRQIGYTDEADRYYRHAQKRLEKLLAFSSSYKPVFNPTDLDFKKVMRILSPTVIKSLFERSKTRFDKGEFFNSLITQVKCIYFIMARKLSTNDRRSLSLDEERMITKIRRVNNFLEAEKSLLKHDRERITYLFGAPLSADIGWPEANQTEISFDPVEISKYIDRNMAPLVNEVLSRMGFTLYTLHRRKLTRRVWSEVEIEEYKVILQGLQQWLHKYFRFDTEVWNKDHDWNISPSSLGIYCETLFHSHETVSVSGGVFHEETERQFALLLRQIDYNRSLHPETGGASNGESEVDSIGRELDEIGFYLATLHTVTQNIGNLITIPRTNRRLLMRRGYKHRCQEGDLSKDRVYTGIEGILGKIRGFPSMKDKENLGVTDTMLADRRSKQTTLNNKLVILRRWQSYNPKIPHHGQRKVRGGGYFLLWQGKGLVIDPGYDFIQNFYDEGFSMEDIDAIVVSHSHPDHDDDLSSLMTLIKEWNEYHEKTGNKTMAKKIDLFLNESTHRKFSAWLNSSDVRIGRVILLPVVCWNKDSREMFDFTDYAIRGSNVVMDLRVARPQSIEPLSDELLTPYHLKLEIVPAWHDDVIGRTAAVGFIFHLYDPDKGAKVGSIGYTGDTGAYGLDVRKKTQNRNILRIDEQYKKCDILIAHLGDIRLRELATVMNTTGMDWRSGDRSHPLLCLLRDSFKGLSTRNVFNNRDKRKFAEKVNDFLNFLITMDLVSGKALEYEITCSDEKRRSVQAWLGEYIENRGFAKNHPKIENLLTEGFDGILQAKGASKGQAISQGAKDIEDDSVSIQHAPSKNAYTLLGYLCLSSLLPWQYPYHLGIFGIYKLFKSVVEYRKDKKSKHRPLFIVGELPEELSSYRHLIARWLNISKENVIKHGNQDQGDRCVYCFTGDIGLHVKIGNSKNQISPRIRCAYCNYNNETVCRGQEYHDPKDILETPIDRLKGRMLYLCCNKDHYPEDTDRPRDFISRPELSLI